jgi:GDP-L-fucose synthase
LIAKIVGFEGSVVLDRSKPDGTPRKVLDVGKLHALGWHATTTLAEGIRRTYDWYVANADRLDR